MISQIGIASLLSALAAISFPVLCQETDSSPIQIIDFGLPCKADKVIGVLFAEVSRGGVKSVSGVRTCMFPSECNLALSISRHDEYIRSFTLCCGGSDCRLTRSEILQRIGSPQPNGLVCSSCSSDRSTQCCTSDTVQCSGNETLCAYHYTETAAERGCATQTYCDHGNYTSNGGETMSSQWTICTKAPETINVDQLRPLCVP